MSVMLHIKVVMMDGPGHRSAILGASATGLTQP